MADANVFANLLNKLNEKSSKGSGKFYHPPAGKTKVRLVLEPGAKPHEFYREVTTSFGKTKYMMLAVVLEGPDLEDNQPEIRGLVVPLTVLKSIVGYLAEGFDLFDMEKGNGLSISREGKGMTDTRYAVNPSPRPVDISGLDLEFPEGGLDELVNAYHAKQAENAANGKGKSSEPAQDTKSADIPW